MPTRYVRLPILTEGGPKALATLDELARQARDLDGQDISFKPTVNDTETQAKFKDLKLKIHILNQEGIEIEAKLKDEKFKAQFLELKGQLHDLSETKVTPDIDLRGADVAEAKLIRIKLAMDSIRDKSVDFKIREDRSIFNQLRGFGRRSSKSDSFGSAGFGKLFSHLFPPPKGEGGGGGPGGGGNPLGRLFSGGLGSGLAGLGPSGIGAAISLALALGPGVVGEGLGLLGGGGLIAGGAFGASYGNKQLKTDLANIKAAQAALKAGTPGVTQKSVRADERKYSKDAAFFGPFIGMLAPFQAITHNVLAAIRPLMGPLSGIFKVMANDIKLLLPVITGFFKASLPFLSQFVRFLAQSGKSLFPAFTLALNTMVKSGALKIMTDSLIILVKDGLVPFLKELGPGMRASAVVFKSMIVILSGALAGLGALATFIAKGFVLFGRAISGPFRMLIDLGKIVAALVTGNFTALGNALHDLGRDFVNFFRALGGLLALGRHFGAQILDALGLGKVGHAIAHAFDGIRHSVASIWDHMWAGIQNSVGHAAGNLTHAFENVKHAILAAWNATWNGVKHVVMGVVNNILHAFDNFKHALLKAFNETTHLISAVWRQFWESTVGNALKHAFDNVTHAMGNMRHFLASAFDKIRHEISVIWDDLWQKTIGRLIRAFSRVMDLTKGVRHDIASAFDRIRHDVASAWDALWHFVVNKMIDQKNRLFDQFDNLWHRIRNGFSNIRDWIKNIWHYIWERINSAARSGLDRLFGIIHRLDNIFGKPVSFVVNHVLDPLVNIWDRIVGAIGQKNLQFHVPHFHFAEGGKVTAGTGPKSDDVIARVSRGETVVSAAHSAQLAPIFSAVGVPGYAEGGIPNPISSALGALFPFGNLVKHILGWGTGGKGIGWIASHLASPLLGLLGHVPGEAKGIGHLVGGIGRSLIHDVLRRLSHLIVNYGSGSGASIVKYAMSFLHKIPYVWGGASLGPRGADCSGFTGSIYRHFGLFPPRTSEAQGDWVKKSGPVPGGLAFYRSAGGGPPPGHVAIVKDGNTVISQGGGMGPVLMGLRGMPLMFTGIPPHGFKTGGGASGGSFRENQLAQLWISAGGPRRLAHLMSAIAMAESGGHANARNPSGASGLWQILGKPFPGNVFNPLTNARMAVAKWHMQGLGAWAVYTNGAYRRFMDQGGWLRPGLNVIQNNTGRHERVLDPRQSAEYGRGGNTYNISITPTPLAHPADIGREVVTAIRQYEKRSGKGWRS